MNKEEFLNKLSHEELVLLRDTIGPRDIVSEIKHRESPKKHIDVEIGKCFIYKVDPEEIILIKVIEDEGASWFTCDTINIDEHNIDYYSTSYVLDAYSDWEPLDSNIYDKIFTIIESRDITIDKIIEEFDKQIREVCLTSLNIPNKNSTI